MANINIYNPNGGGAGGYEMIVEREVAFDVKTANAQYHANFTPERDMYIYLEAKWYGATAVWNGTFTINLSNLSVPSTTQRAVLGSQFVAQAGGNSRTLVRNHRTEPFFLKKGYTYLLGFLCQDATSLTVQSVKIIVLK